MIVKPKKEGRKEKEPSNTKLTVEHQEHWTYLAPFKYLSRRRHVPQTICAMSAADQNVSNEEIFKYIQWQYLGLATEHAYRNEALTEIWLH